jgi:hypothetical protein
MPLSWVRLDANIASHDKILALLSSSARQKHHAFTTYICSLGWCGGQGTDGFVPSAALPFVHGNVTTARLLVKYGLWDEGIGGWQIRNYAERQQLAVITETKRLAAQIASQKANCTRWHGKDCGCWKDAG